MEDNSREININGLTPEEVQMLDMMWNIESQEDMQDWVDSLTREERFTVYRLRNLLIAEIIDADNVQDLSLAQQVLKKYTLNG